MTNNKQQTAVEQFAIALYEGGYLQGNGDEIQKLLEHHLEMEKEQKKNAYDWGETNGADECNGDGATHENFEQYYEETYGGNK
jgi:hypothetical protein